ncbi:MAG: DinB family protein, partial [bacterium]|nr:DinB family protein [bacterium]
MPEKIPWIERKFAFDTPADQFPSIIERLRGTPARVEAVVQKLPPAWYTRKPEHGWTIQSHIGHLVSVEELFDNRLSQFLEGAEELIAADMSNRNTETADYDAISMEDVLNLFKSVRHRFVSHLEAVDQSL